MYADGAAVAGLEPELHHLADEVDRAAFASQPPAPAHVDRAWQYSDRVSVELRRRRNAAQRMRMRLDPARCYATRPRRVRARDDGAVGRAMTDDKDDTGAAADDDDLVWEVNWGASEEADDDDVTVEAGDDLIAAIRAATGSSTPEPPVPRSRRPHRHRSHPPHRSPDPTATGATRPAGPTTPPPPGATRPADPTDPTATRAARAAGPTDPAARTRPAAARSPRQPWRPPGRLPTAQRA